MKNPAQQTKSKRGGARPGAGRKPGGANASASIATKPLTPFQRWKAEPERALSELCDEIVSGKSLHQFVLARALAYTSARDWLKSDVDRWEKYWGACEDRADTFADEIIAIADDSSGDTFLDPITF